MKLSLTLLAALYSCWLGVIGFYVYRSQMNFTLVRLFITDRPVEALQANVNALHGFDWDSHMRHQLALSLNNVIKSNNVSLDERTAERVYEIASSAAPDTPAVLISRLEYLINYKKDLVEAEGLVARLKQNASLQPETWLADSVIAYREGDLPRAWNSALHGAGIKGNTDRSMNMFARIVFEIERTP